MKVRFMQVEPTTRCNFTCGFCVGRHLPQQDLPLSRFVQLMDKIEGLEAMELQGEGEPLMHPEFFTMVREARKRFPNLEISLITNGSMFTKSTIKQLLDHGVAKLFVSVESVKDADFQRIRGGKLDRVRRGIRALLQERSERGLDRPLVGLAVTALKSTAAELPEALPAFYRELGLDGGINIQQLQAMPQYADIYDNTMRAEIPDGSTRKFMTTAIRNSKPLQEILHEREMRADVGFYERLFGSVDTRLSCPWLANGLYMATGGELVPCCNIKDYPSHALARVDGDLAEAETAREKMRKQLSSGQIPPACEGCGIAATVSRNSGLMRAAIRKQQR